MLAASLRWLIEDSADQWRTTVALYREWLLN